MHSISFSHADLSECVVSVLYCSMLVLAKVSACCAATSPSSLSVVHLHVYQLQHVHICG